MPEINLLLVGYNTGVLDALDAAGVGGVVVVEEPDLWRNKGLAPKAKTHPCLSGVEMLAYQQADGYRVLAERYQGSVHAVVAGLEYAVPAAADLAERFGLPGAGTRAAGLLRDKLDLRAAQAGSGLREVRFREVFSAEDVEEFLSRTPRAVLKPANRQASLGVHLLDRGDDVATAWAEMLGADEGRQLAGRTMAWRYLVEERLDGAEVSVEALVCDGRVIWTNPTHKTTLDGPCPVELGHMVGFPSDAWGERMQRLASAIGYGTGILHAEWMVAGGDTALIECAGRPPGDHITELIDLAYNVNILRLWVALMQGTPPELPDRPQRGAAVRFLVPERPGTVVSVAGLDEARRSIGVETAEVAVTEGDTVGVVKSSWDRIGHVIAVAEDPETADRRARAIADRITVVVA